MAAVQLAPEKTARIKRSRSGAAVVEFAVCLPILVIVVFGSIEACNAIFLKQAATAAAYEAARVGTNSGGTQFAAQTRAEEILAARTIDGATLNFNPDDESSWERGTEIAVTVAVPTANNLGGINLFFQGQTLQSTITMVKQ
jgi:Flp pilus assembly protein TadG